MSVTSRNSNSSARTIRSSVIKQMDPEDQFMINQICSKYQTLPTIREDRSDASYRSSLSSLTSVSRQNQSVVSSGSRRSNHTQRQSSSYESPRSIIPTEEFYNQPTPKGLSIPDQSWMGVCAQKKKNGQVVDPVEFYNGSSPEMRKMLLEQVPSIHKYLPLNFVEITHENRHGKTRVSGTPNSAEFSVTKGEFNGRFT